MPLTPTPWHTLDPLATPLAGTERLLADDGVANGRVLVSDLVTAAQVGVTKNADAISQSRVTNLISNLSAKLDRAELTASREEIDTALDGKADADALPVNLTLSTLRLDKRSSPPAAPGVGKCVLWIGQTPGDGNADKWTLYATTGVTPNTTPIFTDIYAPVFTLDEFWSGELEREGQSGSAGVGWGAGGYSKEMGLDESAEGWELTLTSDTWSLPGGGGDVDPTVNIFQKQADDSWSLFVIDTALSALGTVGLWTPGTPTRGLFKLTISPTCVAPGTAPIFAIVRRTAA